MNNKRPRSANSQIILGAFAIGLGVLFLLDNMGILDVRGALSFWPVVFIVFGLVKLTDTQTPNGYFVGFALVAVGVLMILGRMGIIHFAWHSMWPVFMIVAGSALLFRAINGPKAPGAETSNIVEVTAILGGFERRVATQQFQGGEITAVMGGCTLDMRDASIEGRAVINVFAMFGGITIKCPTDWTVVVEGTPVLGGIEEKTNKPPHSDKKLIVRGYAIMGGVEIRN